VAAHDGGPYGSGNWTYGYDQEPRAGEPLAQYGSPSEPGDPYQQPRPYDDRPYRTQQPYEQQPPQPLPQPPQQRSYQANHAGPPAPPPYGSSQGGGQAPARRSTPQRPQSRLVRPYAMTGGRTRPRYQLAIEALVQTTAEPARLQSQLPEHQRICQLCYEIKSVAEISALLTMPLGVARILVADLAEAGLVTIHQPAGDAAAGGQPDVTLLERVLSGLRKL
jgi:Protein of unknown function (DUF742)